MARTVTNPPPIPKPSTYPGGEISAADFDGSGYTGLLYLASSILSLWASHVGTWTCDVLDPAGDRLNNTGAAAREYRPHPLWNGSGSGLPVGIGVDVWLYVVRGTASPTLTWEVQVTSSTDSVTNEVNGGATTSGVWWRLASQLDVDDSLSELTLDLTCATFSGGSTSGNYIEALAIIPARANTLPAGDGYGADADLVFPDLDLFQGERPCSTFLLQYLARLLEDLRRRGGTVYSVADEWDRGDAVIVDSAIVELLPDEIPPEATEAQFVFQTTSSLGASPTIEIGEAATLTPSVAGAEISGTVTIDPDQGGVFVIRSRDVTINGLTVYYKRAPA